MSSQNRFANGSRRRKLRARIAHNSEPCWLCGYAIDYSLNSKDALSFVVDEVVPVSKGGSPYSYGNCKPAHRCCNSWRGNKTATPQLRADIKARFERDVLRIGKAISTSREW